MSSQDIYAGGSSSDSSSSSGASANTCPLQITSLLTRITEIMTQLTTTTQDPVLANRRLTVLLSQIAMAVAKANRQ
jgi:hypothetical protein